MVVSIWVPPFRRMIAKQWNGPGLLIVPSELNGNHDASDTSLASLAPDALSGSIEKFRDEAFCPKFDQSGRDRVVGQPYPCSFRRELRRPSRRSHDVAGCTQATSRANRVCRLNVALLDS